MSLQSGNRNDRPKAKLEMSRRELLRGALVTAGALIADTALAAPKKNPEKLKWQVEAEEHEKFEAQLLADIAEIEKDFKPDGFGTKYFAALSNKKISPKYVGKYLEQLSRISAGFDSYGVETSRDRRGNSLPVHLEIGKYLAVGRPSGIHDAKAGSFGPRTEELPSYIRDAHAREPIGKAAYFEKHGTVYEVATSEQLAEIQLVTGVHQHVPERPLAAKRAQDQSVAAISLDEPLPTVIFREKWPFSLPGTVRLMGLIVAGFVTRR
jgi:hypothetical protein